MLFVCERRRSRRIVERDPRGAERSNQTCPHFKPPATSRQPSLG
jgi:hypothetical protein